MKVVIRPPDDVYWRFRRLASCRQVGAECLSKEDGYLYRVRGDRIICRVVDGEEQETIDSLPLRLPPAAKVMTGIGWGFHMPIAVFYQQVIGPSGASTREKGKTFMNPQQKDELARLTREYGGEWGLNHTHRLLHLVALIGASLDYDHELVWTAAHLHDWGAYPAWQQAGVDHAARSGEVGRSYLTERGFPPAWIERVVSCITTHHQGDPNRPLEALLLSDADALDFLGIVGVLRDFAKKPKALREAYDTSRQRREKLPNMLCLAASRPLAASRLQEMDKLFAQFEAESFGCF